MQIERRQFITSTLLAAGALVWPAAAQDKKPAEDDARIVSLRGRVVCLTGKLQRPYQLSADCEAHGEIYALQTADDKLHPLEQAELAMAIWLDARIRARDLQVTAREFSRTGFLEVIRLQAWRDGKLYNLDYFCATCNISKHKPGTCECCQEPVQLREMLAEETR